ncbi:flagellar hook-associated protein FlgL [Methylobacter svalbardensis]|uniref:flagellar hook-associated protein FlgL n=1 Tax=Methylobacter svalbardensis TaxID=3080016 RepID=UPI0030EF7952
MRISTAWAQQLSVNAMSSQQNQLAKVQQQLSSGLKVSTPAEDPAAAVRVLDLEGTIAKTNQYQSNIATVRGRLNLEESALETANNIMFRVKELTIQGMNTSLNSSDRLSIKFEVDQLIEEMAGVANTKNANGEFIFSGDLSTVPAFAKHPTTGEYVYQGGTQQRALQIGSTRQVADGDLGFNVFENITSSSPAADQAVDQNGNPTKIRSIFNTLKALSDGLSDTFTATPGEITGDRFLRYGLDYSAAPTTFDLTDGGVTTTISLSDSFAGVEDIVTEVNNQLAAAAVPVSATMQARSNGNKIEFVSVATGSTSSITITNSTPASGTFLTDAGFTDSQTSTGVDAQIFQSQLGDVLTDLDAALDSFLQARTSVGTRLNALDNQESQNEKFVLDTTTTLSETQDLDYADAISKFQLQSIALQAGQQAFAQVNKLSLFNYL